MDAVVYVETNFLMSIALGREARGSDLLAAVSTSVRVAIPSGCYMESFSAYEDERKRRHRFREELERQISQLRRDTTSVEFATPAALAALAAVGIGRPFRNVANVLGWLGSLSP